jgi:hypothetical protein
MHPIMDKKTTEISEIARHLMSVERSYLPFSLESLQNQEEIEKVCQANNQELRLKRLLADADALPISDSTVRKYIGQVAQGKTKTAFLICLYQYLQENGSLPVQIEDHDLYGEDFQDWNLWRERMDEFIDVVAFKLRTEEVGTLVVGQNVPPFINRQLARLKICYRLGLDDVAVVFCRALLEAALAEALRRVGALNIQGKIVDRTAWKLGELINQAKKHPRLKNKLQKADRIQEIKEDAGRVLHSKEPGEMNLSTPVNKIIEDTYLIIGELFQP